MMLFELLKHIDKNVEFGIQDVPVSGVFYNSRDVLPNGIFVAIKGTHLDGHRFIPDAIKKGAICIVGTESIHGMPVPYIQVKDSRAVLAKLASAFYDFPARKMTVIGVTGTDGKTTTVNLIYNILRMAGLRVGMISTVNAVIGDLILDTGFHVTTPPSTDVQKYLALMAEKGVTHVVLEATSHGLAQGRLNECYFDIGVVTNVTHEHLDFHGSYESYLAAKGILFKNLKSHYEKQWEQEPYAILNKDDRSFPYLSRIVEVSKITYSSKQAADIWVSDVKMTSEGESFIVHLNKDKATFEVNCPLIGDYNISNCLAAIGVTRQAMGVPIDIVQRGIAEMEPIPGRMEKIDLGQNFVAIVDFAHTPNALKNALKAVRKFTKGRIIAVFGSAGLRDREKRHLMAEVAADLADISILTAEDPRTESLNAILAEMANGMIDKGALEGVDFWRVPNRGDAIRKAIALAQPDDTVIALGKGHEQSMCYGYTEYSWDDRVAMRAALSEYLDKVGPSMPYLPKWD